MHRDLKPRNIMLSEDYNLKVIDFGDATLVEEPGAEEEGAPNKYATRTVGGSMNYMSPEIIAEEEQGCPADIWSAGCILFKLLTGRIPFPDHNMALYQNIK